MTDDVKRLERRLKMRRQLRKQARRRFDREEQKDARLAREHGIDPGDAEENENGIEVAGGGLSHSSRCTCTTCTTRTIVHRERRRKPPDTSQTDAEPFCFTVRRMKRTWRAADRHNDREGLAVDLTIGASRARKRWFDLFYEVVSRDALIRVRHARFDEPVILLSECRFRRLERAARPESGAAENSEDTDVAS